MSHSSRRDFLRKAGGTAALAALGISLSSCDSQGPGGDTGPGIQIDGNNIILDLTKDPADELTSRGGFLYIEDAETLVVNVDGTTVRAFTSICTHQNCPVKNYDAGRQAFECSCHGSRFDAKDGDAIEGPAEDPLEEFSVARDGDTVTITTS